ncbi:hypothetical protein [Nannocystis sp. SCPEA4]|uniref:hypothetical protein n=1 Tax=Nannocystis sp. SCPEA4 TaxID=2996787 RepID=UPI00226EE2CF|nr:hypothetical protein [Nannocystis sp. SCPEA4]MCY1062134.1 hypothetical protein [Nannocystis sp. SCPEA4]
MKLDPNDFLFNKVPLDFVSYFPSDDALASPKFQALRSKVEGAVGKVEGAINSAQTVLETARTYQAALQQLAKSKAVFVGDFLSSWMPKIGWLEGKSIATTLPRGLWAEVPWELKDDPAALTLAMSKVSMDVALTTLSATPVVRTVANAMLSAGRVMNDMFRAQEAKVASYLYLPWSEYKKQTDEDIVRILRDQVFRGVDWMRLFAPPFEPKPWRVGVKVREEKDIIGFIWGPTSAEGSKEFAWTADFGAMPGTFRVAGQTQSVGGPQPDLSPLERRFLLPKGITPRERAIAWRARFMAVGDYYPALQQAGGCAWQWVMKAGSPDMYKVDAVALQNSWGAYWDAFWESAWSVYKDPSKYFPPHLAGVSPQADMDEARRILGHLLMPYLCVRREGEKTWNLGVPFGPTPEPAPWVHPDIFAMGPVPPRFRNVCLWVEEDLKKIAPDWPYRKWKNGDFPRQHPKYRATYQFGESSPSFYGNPGEGWRCVPYPLPEQLAATYSTPMKEIIGPALKQLRDMQFASLEETLVCAYVRPRPLADLPEYRAFSKDEALRNHCLGMREKLLTHNARFGVRLDDVDDIDPAFANKLRESGVTGTWRDRLKLAEFAAAPGKPGRLPEAPPIEGGVAFGELASAGDVPGGVPGWMLGLGALGLGGGIAYALSRRRGASVNVSHKELQWLSTSIQR